MNKAQRKIARLKAKGLSMSQIARETGVNVGQISKLSRGKAPSTRERRKLGVGFKEPESSIRVRLPVRDLPAIEYLARMYGFFNSMRRLQAAMERVERRKTAGEAHHEVRHEAEA